MIGVTNFPTVSIWFMIKIVLVKGFNYAPVLCCALRPNEGCAGREADAAESHGRPRVRNLF